jgi:hypothetical protein
MTLDGDARVPVDAVMTELHGRVRERLRAQIIASGGSRAFDDPALFADVEALLHAAASTSDTTKLILPELLGDPDTWRLTTSMRYQSHRTKGPAALLIFLKRHVLMPVFRWLYEYSRDNFERQRRTNQVLFACVQELAVETAQLRRDVRRLSSSAHASASVPSSSPAAAHAPAHASAHPEPHETSRDAR